MKEELADVERYLIGDIWSSGDLWANLETLCERWPHRFTGSDYDKEAAAFLAERLSAYGLDSVCLEPFAFNGWQRGKPARLDTLTPSGKAYPCLAIPYSQPGIVEGEVIDLGMGMPDDFARAGEAVRGRICLFEMRTPAYRSPVNAKDKTRWAVEAGALAALWRGEREGYLLPTGWAECNRLCPIPAVGLTAEDGSALARLARKGSLRIRLQVDCQYGPSTSQNVVGELRGQSDPATLLVAGAHHDGHDISPAAADNGFGTAVVLEVARALSRQRQHLPRTLRFIFFSGEEQGLLGSFAHVRARAAEMGSIRAMINVDDMPGDGLKNGFALQSHDELVPYFRQMSRDMHWPFEVDVRMKTASDHLPFALAGVPAISLDWLNHTPTWGITHTPADTIEKVSFQNLRLVAMQVARVLFRLTNEENWPARRRDREQMLSAYDATSRRIALELEAKSSLDA